MNSKENLQLQLTAAQYQAQRWYASVVSGAYKLRNLRVPIINSTFWRECTDEEKLENTMAILKGHTQRIQELVNSLIEEK